MEKKVGDNRVKYCSIGCYNTDTKTKGIDGFKPCLFCQKMMPFRNSLKVRKHGNVASVRTKFCSYGCSAKWRVENMPLEERLRINAVLSQAAKGKPHDHLWTKEAIEKRKLSARGEAHWNWQGGITPINKQRRNLAEYRDWRIAVFERDNYTCVLCGARSGVGKAVYLQADHIKPFCNFPELRLDIDNGRTLCVDCHRQTDTYGVKATKKMI